MTEEKYDLPTSATYLGITVTELNEVISISASLFPSLKFGARTKYIQKKDLDRMKNKCSKDGTFKYSILLRLATEMKKLRPRPKRKAINAGSNLYEASLSYDEASKYLGRRL